VAERPLEGRRIVVTRPRKQAEALAGTLRGLGADALVFPLVEIKPADDLDAIAAADPGAYDWVVFTSASAVATVGAGLRHATGDVRVATVGPATAEAVRTLGVEPAFVPERFAAEEIASGLEPLAGTRVLLPQADIANPGLAEELRRRGATVDALTAYRTVEVERTSEELTQLRAADAVVLASGSAARSLARQGGAGPALVVCIGPKTAEVARAEGLEVGLVAPEATSEGIIHALTSHFGENE
jgi:uroporphyrinogen III methyltransferase/synthase